MSRFDSKEGIDYLVDRYAILGVEHTASADEIEAAFRTKIKQWHPDRLQGLAPTLVAQAEHQSNLLNETHEILGNSETRAAFDAKLADWKKPISKDGHSIVDLSSSAFSFSALLGSLSEDPAEREAYAKKTAKQFSNFDEATFDLVQEQMKLAAEASPALQRAYAAQVEVRDLYLTLLEDFLREDLGVRGSTGRESGLRYIEQVQEELAAIQTEAMSVLQTQVLLLATGGQALLPAPEKNSGAELVAAEVLRHYEEKFSAHFEHRAVQLQEIAKERQKLLEERFKAAGITYHSATVEYTSKLIMEFKKDGKIFARQLFIIDGTKLSAAGVSDFSNLDDPVEAEKLIKGGYTIVSFALVPDIEFQSQLLRVAELHVEKMKEPQK